jgi:hypothetical protein
LLLLFDKNKKEDDCDGKDGEKSPLIALFTKLAVKFLDTNNSRQFICVQILKEFVVDIDFVDSDDDEDDGDDDDDDVVVVVVDGKEYKSSFVCKSVL